MSMLATFEGLFGWIYFIAWSATFYPQIFLVLKRKTSAGLSTDFMIINALGFICYAIFTFSSYAVPEVTKTYEQHTGYPPQVDTTDVYFAAHGAVMCSLLVSLLFYYPPRTLPKLPNLIACISLMFLVIVALVSCMYGKLDWFYFLQVAGFIKVGASIVKHFPQAVLNRSRHSTVGWSFTMVVLDLIGGSFSIAQQVLRCFRIQALAPFTSNLAKTFLALESLAFDIYFVLQHLVWYPDRFDIDLHGQSKAHPDENTNLLDA